MDDPPVLRPAGEDDLAVLDYLTNDPEGTGPFEWYGWRTPDVYRRRWEDNGLLGDDEGLLMVTSAAGPLGFVVWRKVATAQTSFCWEIGIRIAPDSRGRGYGTEAQRMIVGYLFAHAPHVNRIQAVTESGNVAEQRALEKAGFTREGVMRGCGFRDGAWRDGVLYSVLRDEVAPNGDHSDHADRAPAPD
jgi:RimJ/RimL family protein N-acetyltransferase